MAALRRALAAVPGHAEASALLEEIYRRGRQFQELDRYFRERIAAAPNDDERIAFLYKRAELAERNRRIGGRSPLDEITEAQRAARFRQATRCVRGAAAFRASPSPHPPAGASGKFRARCNCPNCPTREYSREG